MIDVRKSRLSVSSKPSMELESPSSAGRATANSFEVSEIRLAGKSGVEAFRFLRGNGTHRLCLPRVCFPRHSLSIAKKGRRIDERAFYSFTAKTVRIHLGRGL